MSIQAHTDALAVLADKAVTVTSSADSVEILAQQNIVLHGGDSMIRLEGNAVTFETSGLLSVKGAGHPLVGAGGQATALPALPLGLLGEPVRELELHYHYDDLTPVVSAPYKVTFADGSVREGTLDADGYALLKSVPLGGYRVDYGEDARAWKSPPPAKDEAEYDKKEVQQQGAEMIERALKTEPPIVGGQA